MNVQDRTNISLEKMEEVIESGNVNGSALRNVIWSIVLQSRLDQIEDMHTKGGKIKEEEEEDNPLSVFIEHAKESKEPPKSWEEIRKDMENHLNSPPAIWKIFFGYYKCEKCGCERGEQSLGRQTKTISRCPMCKEGIMRYINARK